MHRTICIALAVAFAAASAEADIRKVKPADRPTFRHAGIHHGKGPGVRELFSDCAAFIAAGRAKVMIPQIWIENCADISQTLESLPPESLPAEAPPVAQQPRINGPSTVTGPGACSVIGEVGRSC
jgi:hypothetical protein